MITYGSYLNQKEDLVKNSAIIVFADTLVATMAGIAVIPAAVANGIASGRRWTRSSWAARTCCLSPYRMCSGPWAPSVRCSA